MRTHLAVALALAVTLAVMSPRAAQALFADFGDFDATVPVSKSAAVSIPSSASADATGHGTTPPGQRGTSPGPAKQVESNPDVEPTGFLSILSDDLFGHQ
jgi:hypothetical protein